jgi:hypothetical protein
MFPLSEVVLMIPRCVALSTDGIVLGPMVKVKLLDSCLRCLWEMYTTNNKLSVTSWKFSEKNPEANTIVTDLRG